MQKRNIRSKLLSLLLTLAMVIGLMPGLAQKAYAEGEEGAGTVTVKLIGSAIDNDNVCEPYEISIPKGTSFWNLHDSDVEAYNKIAQYFTRDGYAPLCNDLYFTFDPLRKFNSIDEVDAADQYTESINDDTTFYVALCKPIDKIELTIEKPICGTKVTHDDSSGYQYKQLNAPAITIKSDRELEIVEPGPFWIDPDTKKPFTDVTLEGGESYKAEIMLNAEFGYSTIVGDTVSAIVVNDSDAGSIEVDPDWYSTKVDFTVTVDHDWDNGTVKVAPTYTKDGSKEFKCKNCGETKTEVIPKLVSIANAKVVLSASSLAYNGKVRKPSIKTIAGKALKSGTDYTVKWSNASSKNVGSYTVTITGKGNYTGVTKATYKIIPKGTSLKAPKKARKAITVKWKRQAAKMSKTRITGYQIQLATNKTFTKNKKTVNVKGYKKVSKKVKKLKAKKKYYIRIRTYKTVSGKKYYSGWSKIKAIKTK